jgi:hypothetical protein
MTDSQDKQTVFAGDLMSRGSDLGLAISCDCSIIVYAESDLTPAFYLTVISFHSWNFFSDLFDLVERARS